MLFPSYLAASTINTVDVFSSRFNLSVIHFSRTIYWNLSWLLDFADCGQEG